MRTRFVAALTFAACLVAGSARAAPFTAHFAAVHDKLAAMRDAFVAPLTKQQKQRRALVVKLLAAVDKKSLTFLHDVQTARTVAVAAARPLHDEPDLPGTVMTLLGDLESDVKARVPALSDRVDALPATTKANTRTKTTVQGNLVIVQTTVDAVDTAAAASDLKAMAGALVKATQKTDLLAKAVTKAETAGLAGCAHILSKGASVTVAGVGKSYRKVIAQAGAVAPTNAPGQTVVEYGDSVTAGFSFNITLAAASIHVGAVPTLYLHYTGGAGKYWELVPGGIVRIVEESATRVGVCIDAVLHAQFPQFLGPNDPLDVSVNGYVVFTR